MGRIKSSITFGGLLLAAGFAITMAVVLRRPAPAADGEAVIVLKEGQDDGRTADILIDGRLNIVLASNPSTGFSWHIAQQPKCLEFVSKDASAQDGTGSAVGVPGQQIFRFRAITRGEGTLRLHYRRAWEKGNEPAKTFKATVRVK